MIACTHARLHTNMNAFIAVLAVLSYSAIVSAIELVSSATAGLSLPLLAIGGAGAGTAQRCLGALSEWCPD